ncbi:UNKNOWN [Stylonychia lemnae]|uniref:Uncharacterized protein n=1 Tax=Stylonychia lemnae TaxID=5949 RepID=A0A078AQ92_STYLE|nr:UNKNOWN [Stylonychia lemnae]|eukprot:CDW83113.1 UNKNOWN [Stylonychia lemnae]
MAPSDTSYDNQQQFMQHQSSQSSIHHPQIISQTQVQSLQKSNSQNQIQQPVIFPPRQFQQHQQQNYQAPQHKFISQASSNSQLIQNSYQGASQSKERDQSQSILNLSDSVEQISHSQQQPVSSNQGQPSALVRQLSEKVRSQAERLQRLESYKQLCEKRIVELDSKHPVPVLPQHMGQKSFSQGEQPQSMAEVKRQLAIKEQDLMYAKQRNEKLLQEIDNLKKSNQSNELQINSDQTQEALRREIQINEQLSRQLEVLNQGNILDKIKQLEDEKNALLDYIEENIEKSQQNTNRSLSEANNTQDKVKQLEYEKSKLFQLCENLKYTEAQNRQKVIELEEQLSRGAPPQELNGLKQQLQEIQQRYNSKCEDYNSLVQKIDPNFQENTFGNIEDLQQKLIDLNSLQRELDFSKEQFESTLGNVKKERDSMKSRIDTLDQRNMDLEEKLRRVEKEKEELWTRAKDQYQGESERVDELLYENDNLRKELDKQHLRIKTLQENSSTLSQTLNETQQELENLVNDHEKLSEEYQRVKLISEDLENERDRLQNQNEEFEREIQKLRVDVIELRKETARQRDDLSQNHIQISNLNDQLYRADIDNREIRHKFQQVQTELNQVQTLQQDRIDKQSKEWEYTIGDLTRELKYVQGELTEKENIFQRVEQELKNKLMCLEEVTSEKIDLRKRIDDLQSELRHIQNAKIEKEEKLKMQIHKNEQLLEELERLNEAYTTIRDEKEATLVVKVEKEREIEYSQRQLQKIRKIAERVMKSLKSLSKQTQDFTSEQRMKAVTSQQSLLSNQNIKTCSNQDGSTSQDPEPLLLDSEQYIYHLNESFTAIYSQYKYQIKQISELKSELSLAQQKIVQLDSQCKNMSEEDVDVREKIRYMETEIDTLREKLRLKDEEKKEQYMREDKIQRQNHQIKQQLEVCRNEQEKLLMQIKSLLVEKERLNEENKQRIDMAENDLDRVKQLEVKLSQIYTQKEMLMGLLEKIKEGMPTDNLQRIIAEIIASINERFRIEEECQSCESQLLQMEGELRQFAKKENQGLTLLSTKVINMRKDVDKQRQLLREIQEQKEIIQKRIESLDQELRCTELSERRRCDVALDTEKTLTEAKFEISNLKREIQFVNSNRKDLEVALAAVQEEKKMIERELLSLRAQLQMKVNNSKQSTMMNPHASTLPPLNAGAALRQGDLLFSNTNSQLNNNNINHNATNNNSMINNINATNNIGNYDSLISQKDGNQSQINNTNNMINLQFQNQTNKVLHFTEQKANNNELLLLADRFTSAEKNQRIMLTGGMNSSRNQSRLGNPLDDAENIQPNRLNLGVNLLSQNNNQLNNNRPATQLQHYKSFQSLDQPLNYSEKPISSHQTSIQRPPLNQTNQATNGGNNLSMLNRNDNINNSINSFKRPLTNRSGSQQKLGRDYEDSLDEYGDEKEYPIRNSLKQRLNQVKNVFSAIRRNLEDQTDSNIEQNL